MCRQRCRRRSRRPGPVGHKERSDCRRVGGCSHGCRITASVVQKPEPLPTPKSAGSAVVGLDLAIDVNGRAQYRRRIRSHRGPGEQEPSQTPPSGAVAEPATHHQLRDGPRDLARREDHRRHILKSSRPPSDAANLTRQSLLLLHPVEEQQPRRRLAGTRTDRRSPAPSPRPRSGRSRQPHALKPTTGP